MKQLAVVTCLCVFPTEGLLTRLRLSWGCMWNRPRKKIEDYKSLSSWRTERPVFFWDLTSTIVVHQSLNLKLQTMLACWCFSHWAKTVPENVDPVVLEKLRDCERDLWEKHFKYLSKTVVISIDQDVMTTTRKWIDWIATSILTKLSNSKPIGWL